ncbi:phosphotransferase [Evansella clarkii]|uniref:phosphotransferase n=1 Tax=Evansella clarkii TaxID=79879 RepID=UPI0009970A7D|nr:phosphotransferase [Evansella clarkii]
MNGIKILESFGFKTDEEPKSIYPYSPVYRVRGEKYDFIIKKTQRTIERAQRLIYFTKYLKENGIKVVTPVDTKRDNPQQIGGDIYIVYPFIVGGTYTGTNDEIYDSGRLLGEIHRLSPEVNNFDLPKYNVFDFNIKEVHDSVQNIENYAKSVNLKIDIYKLKEKLIQIVPQQEELKNSRLPYVATPHDFKANNLIFNPDPYLIDPDNATWLPKVFDLALVLLLFHNELSTAPDEIFTPEQWQIFLSGYTKSVSITELEKEYWQRALEHVFLDEVMWLMAECEEDWSNPSQLKLFECLIKLIIDSSDYHL